MMRSQLNLAKVKNLFASPQKAMCAIRYISGVGSENICISRSSKPSRTALLCTLHFCEGRCNPLSNELMLMVDITLSNC